MNIDAQQRALDRAQGQLDRAVTDGQRRTAERAVERARNDLRRAEDDAAKKLERQGYKVSGTGGRGGRR